MYKIILNDGTVLIFSDSTGLQNIKIENKSFEELETLLTTSNLSNVQFSDSDDSVYGKYKDLKAISMTKYLTDGGVTITLKETVSTQ